MSWKICFFETARGEKIIKEFFRKQNKSVQGKIIREIDLLEQYGYALKMPHSKRLNQDLFELRIRGKEEIRILYSFIGENIHLLHVFKKQTQKTPSKEIATASSRLGLLTK